MKPNAVALALILTLIAGCKAAEPKSETAAAAKATVTDKDHASYLTELAFAKGSAELSPSAKDKLDLMLERARRAGKIDDIKVISWADGEYPSQSMQKLPRPERRLARQRGDSIREYVRGQTRSVAVDTYNMAERPNSLQRLLATSDARMKGSLEHAGIATTAHDLRYPENASKSIVMLIMKR